MRSQCGYQFGSNGVATFVVSARVELTQIYSNADVLQNAGARYLFPIPDNAAVCAFRMETADGRAVRSVVKEKELAKQEFKGAVKSGKWAGLLEEITGDGEIAFCKDRNTANKTISLVFSVSVGAIPHGQDIRVYINVRTVFSFQLFVDIMINVVCPRTPSR